VISIKDAMLMHDDPKLMLSKTSRPSVANTLESSNTKTSLAIHSINHAIDIDVNATLIH